MNVTAHQEKEKNDETKAGKKRAGERENRRSILRKLCAALLQLVRGQHSKKIKESAQDNWDPREVQQPFQPNSNRVGDYTTTLRQLLIGAVNSFRFTKMTYMVSFSDLQFLLDTLK